MRNFVLDSTYKDAVVINQNDEFSIAPSHILPQNPVIQCNINSDKLSNSYISHENKGDKFNKFNFIDYI